MLSLHTQGCIYETRPCVQACCVVPAYAGLYLSLRRFAFSCFCCPCIRRVVSADLSQNLAIAELSLHTQGCIDGMAATRGTRERFPFCVAVPLPRRRRHPGEGPTKAVGFL